MKNIVLIGPSGIGKTVNGKYISKKLGKKFIDTDEEIEKYEGKSVEEIFEYNGEKHFRFLESSIIESIYDKEDLIIATGGGIILNPRNVKLLKKNGMIFLLYGSVETIVNNLRRSNIVRPLIKNNNRHKEVKQMLDDREHLYFSNADYIIYVDNKSLDEISEEIICILKEV